MSVRHICLAHVHGASCPMPCAGQGLCTRTWEAGAAAHRCGLCLCKGRLAVWPRAELTVAVPSHACGSRLEVHSWLDSTHKLQQPGLERQCLASGLQFDGHAPHRSVRPSPSHAPPPGLAGGAAPRNETAAASPKEWPCCLTLGRRSSVLARARSRCVKAFYAAVQCVRYEKRGNPPAECRLPLNTHILTRDPHVGPAFVVKPCRLSTHATSWPATVDGHVGGWGQQQHLHHYWSSQSPGERDFYTPPS